MASAVTPATGKARTRSGGAAVPLDDTDRRVLNLMQGSFPLHPRPYQAVAREAGTTEAKTTEDKTEEVDDLLDEIDSVLEANAEEFVRGFIQKGGE